MDDIFIYADLITIAISCIFFLKNIKKITESSRYIVYLLFFLFYVLPLILDYTIGFPVYSSHMVRGFEMSFLDGKTRIIYDIGLIYTQWVILKYKSYEINRTDYEDICMTDTINKYFIAGMVLPFIATLVLPGPKDILYSFMWREYHLFQMSDYYGLLEAFSYVGIACSVLILLDYNNKSAFLIKFFSCIFIYINICIQGKRSILFFAILFMLVIIIPGIRKSVTKLEARKQIALLSTFSILLIAATLIMSISVKVESRGVDNDFSELYSSLRVDYLRDDRVKVAIFSELNPNMIHILDYYGQSLLCIPTWIFPFSTLFFKPIGIDYPSYAAYLSAGIELLPIEDSILNMTPAIYGELISNFGIILGIVLMPFLCLFFAFRSDKYPYPYNVLLLVSFILLQMYAIKYMVVYFEFVFLVIYMYKRSLK